jgi:phosphoribosyl-AMP cyclohydrolase
MPLPPLKYDQQGLVTAVVQDAETGQVLMVAYMNEEAFNQTLATGLATYFSRSRGKLWRKGESSGHVQRVVEVRVDCDRDAVLLRVTQETAACHDGYRTCFYRKIEGDSLLIVEEKCFEPDAVYGEKRSE